MKYSIIVPVYNVEQYIDRCLKSLEEQTYDKFEVIIVNDGTPDNSMNIVSKYVKRDSRFIAFEKENGGLSDARNYGVAKANGDVIVFVDSDDYVDKDLLYRLNEEFEKSSDIDVVRFQLRLVNENGVTYEQPGYQVFSNLPAVEAYPILLKNSYVDVAWGYAYRSHFFLENGFAYAKGKIHEDLGLTHLILVKAKNISSIDYIGYNYVQREGSITNIQDRKNNLKKAYDTLFHFDNYLEILNTDSSIAMSNKEQLLDYLARALLVKAKKLEKKDCSQYVKVLKKRRLYRYLSNKTLKDKIIRFVIRFLPKFYIMKNGND